MATTAVKSGWSPADAPGLDGRVAIVTGATGGVGFETALGLVRRGATTILAGRNPDKGARALARIQDQVPGGRARFELLDLASMESIRRFADTMIALPGGVIDILVNNAAVMALPTRRLTLDGFEQQVGVNYLGHFVLTAWLKDALCAGTGVGRVISLASLAHRRGRLELDDFQSARSYDPMGAYARSKLAMLVFALELQRRAEEKRWNLASIAVHPGWARTDIIANGMGGGDTPGLKARLIDVAFGLVAQPARDAALPSLYAAMAPEAKGGSYYGPSGLGETRGAPGVARIFPHALDRSAGTGLWALSEQLTGVTFG